MIITSKEQYDKFINELLASNESLVAFDVETSPLDDKKNLKPWDLELYGLGLYTPSLKAYIPKELLDDKFQQLINEKELVGWNSKFDVQVLESEASTATLWQPSYDFSTAKALHDAMIAAWLCNENRTSFKLKDLALSVLKVKEVTRYTDIEERPNPNLSDGESHAKYLKWQEDMGTYCIADCEYTYRLYKVFEKKMKTDGLWMLYDEVERPLIKVVSDMEKAGIEVDVKYLEGLKIKAEHELEQMKKDVLAAIKAEMPKMSDDFNPGSTKQLSDYLYKHKKYKVPEDYVTPSGKPSTNEEALHYLVETYKCEVSTKLLLYRKLNKLYTAFIVGLLEKEKDGVIHCQFRQMGTKTGRFSSSSPNLQQIPAMDPVSDCCESKYDDKTNICGRCKKPCKSIDNPFDIRKAFKPRKGHKLVDADYSQMELRIGAYLSGAKLMVDTFKVNGDLHKTTAEAIGCSRKVAKMVNFSIFYGIGPYGLSRRLGIEEAEAANIIEGFFTKFPEVRKYLDDSAYLLRTQYFVSTELGRRRRFPEYIAAKQRKDYAAVGRCERQAGNTRIQGLNADFTKVAMVSAHHKIKELGGRLLLTVHDEIIAEVPDDKTKEAAAALQMCMESSGNLGEVPIKAEPKILNYWMK